MRRDRVASAVVEQTGLALRRPVVIGEHRRGSGWARPHRRAVLTESAAQRMADAGVDIVRIRRRGTEYEVRLAAPDVRDGPRYRRMTFISVWDSIVRS